MSSSDLSIKDISNIMIKYGDMYEVFDAIITSKHIELCDGYNWPNLMIIKIAAHTAQ